MGASENKSTDPALHSKHTSSSSDRWVDTIRSEELAEEGSREVFVDGRIIALFRYQGDLYGLDGMCAHQGGPLAQGSVHLDAKGIACVTCPWHGWQYELKTGIEAVNRQPLQESFDVREQDGMIQVKFKTD